MKKIQSWTRYTSLLRKSLSMIAAPLLTFTYQFCYETSSLFPFAMSTAAGLMTGYKYDLSSRSVRCLLFDAGDNRWQFVHRLFFIVVPCAAGLVGLQLGSGSVQGLAGGQPVCAGGGVPGPLWARPPWHFRRLASCLCFGPCLAQASAIRPAAQGSRDEVVSVADRCTHSFPKAC